MMDSRATSKVSTLLGDMSTHDYDLGMSGHRYNSVSFNEMPVIKLPPKITRPNSSNRVNMDGLSDYKSTLSLEELKYLSVGMAPQVADVIQLCSKISAHSQIKVVMKNATKGAMVAGGSAFLGGLLAGPPGIAVGGVVGSILGSWLTRRQFRPLPQVLMELTPHQKQELYDDIKAVLGNLDWTDAAQLIALAMSNATLQQKVTAVMLNYITKELRAEVRCHD